MGFYFEFPKKEKKSKAKYDCDKCKRGGIGTANFVPDYIGDNYNGLVILKDYPTSDNVFDSFDIIKNVALKYKIRSKELAVIYMAKCYGKKEPNNTQFKCCFPNVDKTLKELKPKLIIACGDASFQYIMGLSNKVAVSRVRNNIIPNYFYNCLVFPIIDFAPYTCDDWRYDRGLQYHIQDTIRFDLHYIFKQWKEHIKKRKIVDLFLKERKILDGIDIKEIKTYSELKNMFKTIFSLPRTSFDYETTNAYPHDDAFEIVYIGFGYEKKAWVIHEDLWKDKPIIYSFLKRNIVKYLTSESHQKLIQNVNFEDLCSRFVFNTKKINNVFDTMIATHVINEKKGTKSQDFQNLIRFGIMPYNETIKSHLETDDKDEDVKQNDIRGASKKDMVLYNGLDCITCYANAKLLIERYLPKAYPKAITNYKLLMRGVNLFANLSHRGVFIGDNEFNDFSNLIEDNLGRVMLDIMSIPEVREYNKYLKENMSSVVNLEDNLIQLMQKNRKQRTRRKLILK